MASGFLGKIIENICGNNPMSALIIGGFSMATAALATLLVVRSPKRDSMKDMIQSSTH
jgi:hypothetical protein